MQGIALIIGVSTSTIWQEGDSIVSKGNYIQQDGSNFIQQDGISVFLEN